ncbi:MAG: class I SAM-dependent methyltransferase [Candidatus Diapherotrites archaeon]|uniref:Class I SAM-dependent methyltransferase n=1 Tax=Candidatus Iainarchaeum sp. TaxID=3101447 RepID=A0A8T4C6G0_9ARCH|nr:class I SAM-dependent methyltransferase [Candidatus Diapherotrites archaeon]
MDTHVWNKLPPREDVIVAKQVFEHIPADDIPDFFSRFIQKSPRIVFTITNYWAPSFVFLNDYTHINNQSLRTWVYWLRRAGYTTISFARLGAGKKIPLVSVLNRFLGGNDPCHSLIISAAAEKQ